LEHSPSQRYLKGVLEMPTPQGIAKYLQLLKNLFPKGLAWNWVKEDKIGLIESMASEFCRVEEKATNLLDIELDPRTSVELLTDWETLLGLPDECTPDNIILQDRQKIAGQRLAAQGGVSAAYLEDLILRLGFDSEVSDFVPFRAGWSRVGDRLTNDFDNQFRVGINRVGEQLRVTGWRFVFNVDLEATSVTYFRVGQNRVGERLVLFENETVECAVYKYKLAHMQPFFTFGLVP
jgi:uncharacterized protein YmfQ (DUF2313 family)